MAALGAALALGACSPAERGGLAWECTPDGATQPAYLLTRSERGDGLALGSVRDLADGRWLAVGRPMPFAPGEFAFLVGDDLFVLERQTGDLKVLERARGGVKLRGGCDPVPFVAAPETGASR